MLKEGPVFQTLINESALGGSPYGEDSLSVIRKTVSGLSGTKTSAERPGMLLGMIQSGKTRSFLGVIALAADNDFAQFIVLTKGTKALTTQTYERLKKAFETVIDLDELRVFDIMTLPKLTLREQRLPIIIVAKKEKRNLERLHRMLFETYPDFAKRRTLIIDDEADYASVGFRRTRTEQVELQTVMQMIDGLRAGLPNASFLQVTATPYSLYLQPNDLTAPNGYEFQPVRPAFTELVPIHDAYVGGRFYFEDAQIPGHVASYLYEPVELRELEVLHHQDRRRYRPDEALTSNGIPVLRQAIVTFIVGGLIRRLQAKQLNEKPKKYSFIIHTEFSRQAHAWQELIVESVVEKLRHSAATVDQRFIELVREAYDNLAVSVRAASGWLPDYETVLQEVEEYLPAIQVEKVNSEKDVIQLLDREGQLELRNRLNIFIGGQILDRGLTIGNLIGFYYGRRASRFQQDTVLQHSRMYGARPLADLAVTRFYTSAEIYGILRTIHEFDSGLRQAFELGGNRLVAFIHKDATNRIVPCSPNKVLVSSLTTLRAGKRLLPVAFQTNYKSYITRPVADLDRLIDSKLNADDPDVPVLIDVKEAFDIVDRISKTFVKPADSGFEWNVTAFKAAMEYISQTTPALADRGKVFLIARKGRNNVRIRESGRYFDAPDTSHVEGELARATAVHIPMMMLFRQEGEVEQGWRGTPFWWPVLYMPTQMRTVVFASDLNEFDENFIGSSQD